jgi:hypothetical protein
MYEAIDNLPDDFYNEQELMLMAEAIVNPPKYCTNSKHLCWFHLMKDGGWTGKSMVLAVESIVDGIDAVNRMVKPHGLSATLGEHGTDNVLNNWKIDAVHLVLDKYRYTSKIKFVGDDRVYNYEDWMVKLTN